MIRTLAALAVALAVGPDAFAQLIVRPPPAAPRPAGVIQPPTLSIPGQNTPPSPTSMQRLPRRSLAPSPFLGALGYGPFWSDLYDSEPLFVNNVPPPSAPTVIYVTPPAPPAPPPELRSRLTLSVPLGARVYLAGKEVDANARPTVLESPVLQAGQAYSFHIKVTWTEGQRLEERSRSVTVDAGDEKSLTYQ